jgi:hypothetical protein
LASLHVHELEPVVGESHLASSGAADVPPPKDAPVIAATSDGHRLVAYLPVPRALLLTSASGMAWCVSWIDMQTRERTAARLEPASGDRVRVMPPGAQDSLLIAATCRPAAGPTR